MILCCHGKMVGGGWRTFVCPTNVPHMSLFDSVLTFDHWSGILAAQKSKVFKSDNDLGSTSSN